MLMKTGMYNLAMRRTRNIVQRHCIADSKISTIAADCYMQGVRDTSQSLLSEEEDGRSQNNS